MNKDTFLNILRNQLGNIKPDVLDEIIFDFEDHFFMASDRGATEDEICADLGDPYEIAKGYLDELSSELTNKPAYDAHSDFSVPPEPPEPPEFEETNDSEAFKSTAGRIQFDGEKFGKNLTKGLSGFLHEEVLRKIKDGLNSIKIDIELDGDFGSASQTNFEGELLAKKMSLLCFNKEECNEINLNLRKADIKIHPADAKDENGENCLKFIFTDNYGNGTEVSLFKSPNGSFNISDTGSSVFGKNSCTNCDVFVSKKLSGILNVNTHSGDIFAQGITLEGNGKIFSKAISGDIKISDCRAEIHSKCTSGDVTIRNLDMTNVDFSDVYSVSTSSGDIVIDGLYLVNGSCEFSTGSGDIEIANINASVFARTGSGDIAANAVNGEFKVSTGSGDIKASGIKSFGGCNTGSGDISIDCQSIDNALRISTGSGDVKLRVIELFGHVELNSSLGTIFMSCRKVRAGVTAKSSVGEIKLKFGKENNLKFDIEAERKKCHWKTPESSSQYPEIFINCTARHGSVVIEEIN